MERKLIDTENKEAARGKWVGRANMINGNTYYYCSECGYSSPNDYELLSDYCSKCGAKMNKE